MKKLIAVLLLFTLNKSFAQTLPDFEAVKLENKADYKEAEPGVLQAATYLLAVPYDKKDAGRGLSVRLLIRWMQGTPDYTFTLDKESTDIAKGNNDLFGLYLAGIVKYSLEHKDQAKEVKTVKLNAIKLVLAYCEQENNNMKMSKRLKKLSEANKKGELEKEL